MEGEAYGDLTLVISKIDNVRNKLKRWSFISVNDLMKKAEELQNRIKVLVQGRQDEGVAQQIKTLTIQLNETLHGEELMWHQRSRVNRLNEGEKNMRLFHGRAFIWKKKNTIKRLKNRPEVWHEDKNEIEEIINNYFKDIFTSSQLTSIHEALSGVDRSIDGEMNRFLSMPFTVLEVTEAISQMGATKSPGPNSFPALFYQKYCNQVGNDVTEAILHYLNEGVHF